MTAQRPLRRIGARKREIRTQFAVIGYRVVDGKVEVCLVTSRGTGRWIVPKGWPMAHASPAEAAATEAWEEAGIKGAVHPHPVGLYSYQKRLGRREDLPVIAVVYAMAVETVKDRYPEARQRRRKWMTCQKAAGKLSDPELARIVRHFDPAALPR